MNRIDATRNILSRNFASRPVRVAVAVKIAFAIMAANVSFAAAKAIFAKPETNAPVVAASLSSVSPFILQINAVPEGVAQTDTQDCREVVVSTDEGYGVQGSVTRVVCRKAL